VRAIFGPDRGGGEGKDRVIPVLNEVWGVEVQLHVFLTSVLDGGKFSPSSPGRFTPGERATAIHWSGGWVGLRAGLTP